MSEQHLENFKRETVHCYPRNVDRWYTPIFFSYSTCCHTLPGYHYEGQQPIKIIISIYYFYYLSLQIFISFHATDSVQTHKSY